MRNPLIAIILLLSCFCTSAQDFSSMSFKEARAYYQTASEAERNRLDEQMKNTEKVFRKQQILEVAGIPFGISVEEALPMIEKVFGTTCVKVDYQTYSIHDIMYEGQFFDHAMFVFQSDILDHTWLCQAVFLMAAETQTQALSHQQMLKEQFEKKICCYQNPKQSGRGSLLRRYQSAMERALVQS